MKNRYTEAFKEQALLKVYSRRDCTIREIAGELNMNVGTLKGWMRGAVKGQAKEAAKPAERASDFSLDIMYCPPPFQPLRLIKGSKTRCAQSVRCS